MTINVSNGKLQTLLCVCAISSPIFLGFLIAQSAVNVPFWDEWVTPGNLFNKIHDFGYISFTDLIEQHNESRKVFPKLVFLTVAYLTHWDTRYQMALIFLMACLISINLFYIACETTNNQNIDTKRDRRILRPLMFMVLANLLIFSPAQHENWLWGIQIVVFVPILCLTTGVLLWHSKFKLGWKVLLSAILSTVSTFSYANGLLCWLLFPLTALFLGHWKILRERVNLIIFWAVSCASNLTLYFWGYTKPGHHPSLTESLFHPVKALTYFLTFLGSSLSGNSLLIAPIVGLIMIVLYGFAAMFLIALRDSNLFYRAGGWLVLGLYTILSAIVTTFGRLGFGIEQALSSRYTTFSVYGIVALLGLIFIWMGETYQRRSQVLPKIISKRFDQNLTLALLTILVILNIVAQGAYLNAMNYTYRDRLYSKTCLTYVNFVEDRCINQSLLSIPDIFRRNLKATRALGILKQEDFAQNAQPVNTQSTVLNSYDYGWIDDIQPINRDDFRASGWATLENLGRTADAVLLSYQDDNGENKVFTVAPVKFDRPDVSKVKKNSIFTRSGWAVQFSRKSLPSRKVEIKAWAYDVKTKNSYPLNGAHKLN